MEKELLFKSRLGETEVDVPGVGTVRVRALSHAEAMRCRMLGAAEKFDEVESLMLCCAVIEPRLTAAEVEQWRAAAMPGEIDVVTRAISTISGLADEQGAQKSG